MFKLNIIMGIIFGLISCFFGVPAWAQTDSADEGLAANYIFMDMEYPSITQVAAQQLVLVDFTASEDLKRFTYLSPTAADDLNRYVILLIKKGFYFSSEFVEFSTPGEYLAMQFPDTENNIFRNVKMEYKAEGYVITIWAGYDMYTWPEA